MDEHRPPLSAFLLPAIACGLLFGTLEALETWAIRMVPQLRLATKPSAVVLVFIGAPLVHLGVCTGGAVLCFVLTRLGVRVRPAMSAGLSTGLGALGVAANSEALGHVAALLLATGIGTQGWLFWRARPHRRLVWRMIASALVVIAAATAIDRLDRHRRADRSLAVPPRAGRDSPNVLLIVLDTVRADHLSPYGSHRTSTPTLSALASDGVLFERAYAAASWTLPSHASLLTGLPPTVHGAERGRSVLSNSFVRLPELIGNQGYSTGAFVANNGVFDPEHGFDRGFDVFETHFVSSAAARTAYGRLATAELIRVDVDLDRWRSAQEINDLFDAWQARLGDRPFFAVLNYMEAHSPYRHDGTRPSFRVWTRQPARSAQDNAILEDAYDRSIESMDAALGRLFTVLRQRSIWDNTLVVVVADHGESMEQGVFDHGFDLTSDLIHVPLIVRLPGRVPAGVRVPAPVSLVDVGATIQDVLGEGGPRLPGRSLAPMFAADTPDGGAHTAPADIRSELLNANDPAQQRSLSIVSGNYHYIVNRATGKERLFDVIADPEEHHDLISDPTTWPVTRRMREATAGWQEPGTVPRS